MLVSTGVLRRSEVSDPLELEIKTVVSCLMWVLGAELGFSPRALYILNH